MAAVLLGLLQQPPLEALRRHDHRHIGRQGRGEAIGVVKRDHRHVQLRLLVHLPGEHDRQRRGVAGAQLGNGHADAGQRGVVGAALAVGDEYHAGAGDGGDAGVEVEVAGGDEDHRLVAGGALGLDGGDDLAQGVVGVAHDLVDGGALRAADRVHHAGAAEGGGDRLDHLAVVPGLVDGGDEHRRG